MRARVVTTSLLILGLILLLAWPFVVGGRPAETAPRREMAEYGLRVLIYFGLTCATFLGAAIGALVVARRAREEFLEKQSENLNDLLEGTLRDHTPKPD